MTARHIIQATILERGVVQREPDGYRIGRGERPIRNVEMEGRRITVRLLDQGLVVPDPDAIDTRQVCDEFPEPRLQQQAPYRLVGLPEIIALGEDLIVVLLVFRSRGRRILLLPRPGLLPPAPFPPPPVPSGPLPPAGPPPRPAPPPPRRPGRQQPGLT